MALPTKYPAVSEEGLKRLNLLEFDTVALLIEYLAGEEVVLVEDEAFIIFEL